MASTLLEEAPEKLASTGEVHMLMTFVDMRACLSLCVDMCQCVYVFEYLSGVVLFLYV